MRKQSTKKLSLHRETLCNLEEGHLGRVVGGETQENTFCLTNCPWCPPSETYPNGCTCSFTC